MSVTVGCLASHPKVDFRKNPRMGKDNESASSGDESEHENSSGESERENHDENEVVNSGDDEHVDEVDGSGDEAEAPADPASVENLEASSPEPPTEAPVEAAKIPARRGRKPKADKVPTKSAESVAAEVPAKRGRKPKVATVNEPVEAEASSTGRTLRPSKQAKEVVPTLKPKTAASKKKPDLVESNKKESDDSGPAKKRKVNTKKPAKTSELTEDGHQAEATEDDLDEKSKDVTKKATRGKSRKVIKEQDPEPAGSSRNVKQKSTKKVNDKDESNDIVPVKKSRAVKKVDVTEKADDEDTVASSEAGLMRGSKAAPKKTASKPDGEKTDSAPAPAKRTYTRKPKVNPDVDEMPAVEEPKKRGRPKKVQAETSAESNKTSQNGKVTVAIEHCKS